MASQQLGRLRSEIDQQFTNIRVTKRKRSSRTRSW